MNKFVEHDAGVLFSESNGRVQLEQRRRMDPLILLCAPLALSQRLDARSPRACQVSGMVLVLVVAHRGEGGGGGPGSRFDILAGEGQSREHALGSS